MIQTARKGKAFLFALALGGLIAINLGAGIAIAAGKGEEVAAETTAEEQEDTSQNTGTQKKKGFFGKKFQEMKDKGIKKFAIDTATTARRAGCTNTIFSATNFGPALDNCIANYPEDMAKMLKDLKEQFNIKKGERLKIEDKIIQSLKKYKYKGGTSLYEFMVFAVRGEDKDAEKIVRESHEAQDKSAKDLYKTRDNLVSVMKKLEGQTKAIKEASLSVLADLTVEKVKIKRGSKSDQRLDEKREKVRQFFPRTYEEDIEIEHLIEDRLPWWYAG
jgi:hypothetical protein